MKRLILFKLLISIIVFPLIISCRSSENKNLDRFLGMWELGSSCTQAGPGIKSTLVNTKITIAKAKPDGIWFTLPPCGNSRNSQIDLYLQFESKSYYLKVRNGNDFFFLDSFHDGSGDIDIPLVYSEASGFSMSGQNHEITIEWKGGSHVWTFSHSVPNKEATIQTLTFSRK